MCVCHIGLSHVIPTRHQCQRRQRWFSLLQIMIRHYLFSHLTSFVPPSLHSSFPPSLSPLHLSDEYEPALLGINRLWVHSAHRRQGIATTLIGTARWDTPIINNYLNSVVPKLSCFKIVMYRETRHRMRCIL